MAKGAARLPEAVSLPVRLTASSTPYVVQVQADQPLPSGAHRMDPTPSVQSQGCVSLGVQEPGAPADPLAPPAPEDPAEAPDPADAPLPAVPLVPPAASGPASWLAPPEPPGARPPFSSSPHAMASEQPSATQAQVAGERSFMDTSERGSVTRTGSSPSQPGMLKRSRCSRRYST